MTCKCGAYWIGLCTTCGEMAPVYKWIKITEKLPEKDSEVLIVYCKNVEIAEFCSMDFWLYDNPVPIEDVLFWMPLPKPPEG